LQKSPNGLLVGLKRFKLKKVGPSWSSDIEVGRVGPIN
jgi:hypothetical protein